MKKNILIILVLVGSISCSNRAKRADEAEMHFQFAQTLLTKGEATQGLSEIIQAVEMDPSNSEYQNLLGLAYLQHNRMDLAEQHLKKAVKIDPKFSEAQNNLCSLLIQKEKFDDAIKYCMAAVGNVLYPTPERAYQNLGMIYQKKGDIPKAIESFQKALFHNSNFVMSRKSLGMILAEQKKLPEAATQLDVAGKTCMASPKGSWGNECPEVFYNLGLLYVKMKGQTKAVGAFRSCVESDQQGTYGEKCREKLKIME